jgi:hypothetical protein
VTATRTVVRGLVNFGLAEIGWFAAVAGAAAGRPWLGPLVATGVVVVHLVVARGRVGEWLLLGVSGIVGLGLDGLLKVTGVVAYAADLAPAPWLAPVWIVALWLLFATMLNESLAWLQGRPALAAVLGAVFGPLSYLAGARLEAAWFPRSTTMAMAVLALMWAAVLPLFLALAEKVRNRGIGTGRAP